MSLNVSQLLIAGAVVLSAGVATAQPVPIPVPLPPPPPTDGTPPPPTDGTPPPPTDGTPPPPTDGTVVDTPPVVVETPPPSTGIPTETIKVEVPVEEVTPAVDLPELLLAPSGAMLHAGVIYSRSGVDTSGGLSSDMRFGLGDVAEFGVAVTDLIRAREAYGQTPRRLAPFYTATFRMGLAENRLFRHQPALALGFRKSFEFEKDNHRTRVAELHLAASMHAGLRTTLHLNGSFWDASVETGTDGPVLLHDQGLAKQFRVGGGVAVRAVEDADILVDFAWVPEFCFTCTAPNRTRLRPILSWGVRYDLASWAQLQSGVRVPDIGDANLLDAQIFGQLTIINRSLERVVARRRQR